MELLAGPLVGGAIADKVRRGAGHSCVACCRAPAPWLSRLAYCFAEWPRQFAAAKIVQGAGIQVPLGSCSPAMSMADCAALKLRKHLVFKVELTAACLDQAAGGNWGNLVIALDPGLLGDEGAFRRGVAAVLARTKAATPLPGVESVTLPGEQGSRLAGAASSDITSPDGLESSVCTTSGNLLTAARHVLSASGSAFWCRAAWLHAGSPAVPALPASTATPQTILGSLTTPAHTQPVC